jgi:PTH1 family peptidyl-tRNA hydrolase
MVTMVLADRVRANFKNHKTNSAVAEGRSVPGGPKLVLAKPNSFMNLSGGPVAALLRFYSLDVSRLIVVHDELDLPFDTLKIKVGGGHGGHNGLRDIIAATGSNDFIRIRMGIGRPPGRQNAADFVLHDYSNAERQTLPTMLEDAADAIELIITDGVTVAQQKFHAPPA